MRVDVEELVAVHVDDAATVSFYSFYSFVSKRVISLIALAVVIVNDKMHGTRIEEAIQVLGSSLGLGSRDLSHHLVLDSSRHCQDSNDDGNSNGLR